MEMSRLAAAAVGLGYVGIDIVVDPRHGPMLLEANARPGLAIQMANGMGLWGKLKDIDAAKTSDDCDQQSPTTKTWRHDAPNEPAGPRHRH
jgi:hypothetical protein